jgi:hypothetical protein
MANELDAAILYVDHQLSPLSKSVDEVNESYWLMT